VAVDELWADLMHQVVAEERQEMDLEVISERLGGGGLEPLSVVPEPLARKFVEARLRALSPGAAVDSASRRASACSAWARSDPIVSYLAGPLFTRQRIW
jgi:hypothetical protein